MATTTLSHSEIDDEVAAVRPAIDTLALDLWALAELSLEEVQSAALIAGLLEAEGFAITSRAAAGIPTAFVAEWGQGEPKLGLLMEYDALPGLGNEALPEQKPRADGVTNGHACGHNLIAASAFGAAVAVKRVMARRGLAGTLRAYGCAAEETEGAKLYMARAGLFDDLDACLHDHPMDHAAVAHARTTAADQMRIDFRGTTAHAGFAPWLGRSAVDAAELFAHGVNLMREHLEPTARVHYVYESAGTAPNVVPDFARVWLFSRDVDRARVERTRAWIEQIADGAAMATQTRATVHVFHGLHDLLPNTPLAQRVQHHLERVGTPRWSEEEQAFAREIQDNVGVAPNGMAISVAPLPDEPMLGGSTDVGDVSWICPTSGVAMPAVPLGISLHTWAATACHGMSLGLNAAVGMARVLAATGLDIVTDPALRTAAREDFTRRTGGRPYRSPLPPEQTRPSSLPDWLIPADDSEELTHGL